MKSNEQLFIMKCKVANNAEEAWDKQDMKEDYAHGWIQWQGTNVCMDVHCLCGELSHVDADFCHHVKCGKCGRVYFCNGHIEFIELKEEPKDCVVVSDIENE